MMLESGQTSLLDVTPRPSIDVESLEISQKQRRASMSMRRTSLAEVIPDWPMLNKAKKQEKVFLSSPQHEPR